ncbi:carbohydrate binding-domain-containing protein [Mycena amicta]|nr:carbohydrate binding-domain-containing protein [Mycena amicta]
MFSFTRIAIFTALAATNAVVLAQDLLNCGVARYENTQYTCFDDSLLCPVQSGIRTLRCGDACYNPNQYTCSNTTLVSYFPSTPGQLFDCGAARYDPSAYVCYDGDFLCPKFETVPTLPCGDACYSASLYICQDGVLEHNPGPEDCIPSGGTNEFCNDQGCFLLGCCPGLLSMADRCRDPCEFTHNC